MDLPPPLPFDDGLRTRLADRLGGFDARTADSAGLRQAAVCVAVVPEGERAAFVICRRGRRGSHRGQWGLPGGGVDADETPQQAAVRELEEEVGLAGEVLGRLDDYTTRSGFHLSPFVVWCPDGQAAVASPDEIASVHLRGLEELVRPDSPRWVTIPESDRAVIQLPIADRLIHAPTAAVLYQFAEVCLRGRATRVDGVEEPVFAWR